MVPNSYLIIDKLGTTTEDRKKHERGTQDELSKIQGSGKYKGTGTTYDVGDGSSKGYHVETSLTGLALLNSSLVGRFYYATSSWVH